MMNACDGRLAHDIRKQEITEKMRAVFHPLLIVLSVYAVINSRTMPFLPTLRWHLQRASQSGLRWAKFVLTLDGQKIANCQSLAFSECSQLWRAIPQFHVEQMLNE